MHVLDLFNDKDRNFLNGGSTVAEGGMPDLNLEYQDYLKLPPMAFQSRYKMSKEAWAEKYKNLLPKPAPVDPTAGMPEAPLEEGDVIPMPARIKTATPQSGPADVIPMIKDRTNRAYEMWKQRILQANPNSVGKIKFYSKGNNIVAQIPSMAEPLGTFNIDTYKGNVLNEVDPHNFDSDWDYQDALARSGRTRSSYRSPDSDDTSDADVAYSKKMYQLSQKQKRDADHDRLATGTNESSQRGDTLVTDALRIMKGPTWNDAVAALKIVLGNREYNSRSNFYKFYVDQILDMYGQQGVTEGSDNITAVFSGYGNYMKGRGANVFKHYGITVLDQQYDEDEDIVEYTVSGDKESLDKARAYLERSDQFGGMILKQGVAEGLSEARNSLFAFVKQQFPTWPDYVLKDFLYQQAKGIRDQAELDDFLKRNKQDFGNCKWTLTKLPITFDIFTPKTQRMLASREGGSSNPFQVPRDAERHAQQSQMIQQKGVSAEPIIVAKLANGYDLIEGWHRTIQHLKTFPQGYTGPAWVCTGATYKSESLEQGVAEGKPNLKCVCKTMGPEQCPVHAPMDEGWLKNTVAGAAIAGAALGAQARVTPDGQGGYTGGLKPSATVTAPADNKPAAEAPKGFSKEYLQSVIDGKHPRPMISVEKAQQLLKQMQEAVAEADMNRRGFLKGMGAAAVAGVGAGSQAQTDQRYDLGNSFVTASATIDGVTYRAIQDTISKSGYMLNQRSDGTPIVNRPGEFLVIRNGKIEARPSLAPNIIRALQKAGILPDNGEMQSQTAPAVTHSSRGGTNQPAVTHSSRGGTNQPAVTYSSSGRITRNEDTTSRMKMDDYIKAAEALQDKLTQAIKQGNQELIKKLSKEREELDARGRSGMVPEAAGDAGSKHRISLTVTDPNHPMASKRQETIQKSVRVPATRADGSAITADDAVKMAVKHHKKKGYRVHSAEHLETIGEGNMQSLLASYKNLIKRAIAIIFGKKQPTNDPAAFQRMMSKIVAPADSTRYQALWQEYKNDKHYHVPTPHPFKDINNKEKMYLWANSLSQFVSDKYSDAPIETLVHLVAGLTEIAVKEALKQSRSGLDEAAQQKPRVRKYTKMRPDGSKAVRYEVLDHMGRRITGQGPEGFDDLKRAKDFYYKNYDRLASLDETADGNVTDTVKMDVPLLIRIMEFSREDAKTDMELHDVVERLIELGKTGDTLTMQDYQDAVASVSAPEQPTQSEPVMKEAGGRYWCSTDKRWKDR